MHAHYPRPLGLAPPTVFLPHFVSIHLHFYARLVVRDVCYCHEYIKKTINHDVIQSEAATHLSCSLGALLLITHSGQDRDKNPRRTCPHLPSSTTPCPRLQNAFQNIFLFLSKLTLFIPPLRFEINLMLFHDQVRILITIGQIS